jgi:hypothetical protein
VMRFGGLKANNNPLIKAVSIRAKKPAARWNWE